MTKVRVDFYKYTGKHYDSFEYVSELPCFEIPKIRDEVQFKSEFIKGMNFTIEVDEQHKGWNKYLFLVDISSYNEHKQS